ncbi:SAM domain-containing protein SAMSN-1-like isoform X2 [Scyliorhinus canicula]|uniref:SAM domain-containing protein SAMSN-1-like isoform X2 n=1 Tax=Scyliorhinus canicula TaxID=7830 RepID=UPI0018F42C8B|nr:SAM domain-containing protein SAMSN-1-like isoform X2 [Scyliorhinus canicula]
MNLFCFSLEGSMDSLYEPVRGHQDYRDRVGGADTINPSLPDPTPTWRLPQKSESLEFSEASKLETKIRKKAKNSTQRPMSDGASLDWNVNYLYKEQVKNDEGNQLLKRVQPGIEETEEIGTLKRLQKLVWNRRSHSSEDGKQTSLPHAPGQGSGDPTCAENPQNPQPNPLDKECGSETQGQIYEPYPDWDLPSRSLIRIHSPKWYEMPELTSPWDGEHHACCTKLKDSENLRFDVTLPMESDWSLFCPRTYHCQSTVTGMDLSGTRTSSFGSFDRFRHHSHAPKPEEKADNSNVEAEQGMEAAGEQSHGKCGQNGSGLGKTMRAISKTMRKRMARKYAKALSEEMCGTDAEDPASQTIGEHEGEDDSLKAGESTESLYSLNSGQSSSSGLASSSDATSNRDSMRLEEEVPYTGPFCCRAKVHTDFTPSPYDTDSLKLKRGDFIDIINKPTMGTWTGMLNGKVGNFKFIYVDILPDEDAMPKKLRTDRRSKQPVPDSLQELLETIQLPDLYSTLLLNGYQNLEDLKDLKECHLIELNVTDAEQRAMLLSAAQQDYDVLSEEEEKNDVITPDQPSEFKLEQAHLIECPRDSGCYATSEISDNGKEDLELENLQDIVGGVSLDD